MGVAQHYFLISYGMAQVSICTRPDAFKYDPTILPQYYKYCGTTVRYLPTSKIYFSEDFRTRNQFIDQ